MRTALLTVLVLVVFGLHQDVWNWKKVGPLLFGFLPVGLAYHAAYTLLAAATMWLLIRFAWPKHLETADREPSPNRDDVNAKP